MYLQPIFVLETIHAPLVVVTVAMVVILVMQHLEMLVLEAHVLCMIILSLVTSVVEVQAVANLEVEVVITV
jgi:hypothetical protein